MQKNVEFNLKRDVPSKLVSENINFKLMSPNWQKAVVNDKNSCKSMVAECGR